MAGYITTSPPIAVSHVRVPQVARQPATMSLSTGAFPLATFPNYMATSGTVATKSGSGAHSSPSWSPAQAPSVNVVEKMRKAVQQADWQQLYLDQKTKFLVSSSWSADEQRCGLLQTLCATSGARRVLEIGACCGVATLAMAQVLPDDGEVVSLEIDPYLADFGKQYWARSPHGRKITSIVGPASEYLGSAAAKATSFDLVVIDADKDGMWSYYLAAKEVLSQRGAIVLDTTPYKGQPPDRYVKYGAVERWESNSGQAAIQEVLSKLQNEASFLVSAFAGVTVLCRRPQSTEPEFSLA